MKSVHYQTLIPNSTVGEQEGLWAALCMDVVWSDQDDQPYLYPDIVAIRGLNDMLPRRRLSFDASENAVTTRDRANQSPIVEARMPDLANGMPPDEDTLHALAILADTWARTTPNMKPLPVESWHIDRENGSHVLSTTVERREIEALIPVADTDTYVHARMNTADIATAIACMTTLRTVAMQESSHNFEA